MPKFYSPRRLCQDGVLAALLMALGPPAAYAQSAPSPPSASVIPPIVLQGCSQKVKPKHAAVFANGTVLSGGATGERVIGFDVSFVNTTAKVAKIVMIRIGDTEFTKIGSFAPDKVIAWRLAARPGDCMVTAVRFDDGSEWSAPSPPSPSP
jgi:hypothetical protein